MRLVMAVIEPTRLRAVQDALASLGVERMTICDALDDRTVGGARSQAKLLRQVVLEIAVNEDFLDRTMQTIERVARGSSGDMFVIPLEEVVRLSDAVRGVEAVS